MTDLEAGGAHMGATDETDPTESTADGAVAVTRSRGRLAPYVAGGVAVVAALLVLLLAVSDAGDKATRSPLLGKAAPPIVGTGFRGDSFDLDLNRGKWVVVNFFSTTCVPCQQEHPELVELERRHRAAGDLAMVSVTFEDRPAAVQSFFTANGGSWPVLLNDTGKVAISYGVTAVPESYLIAPSGLVAVKVIGGVTADDIDGYITALGG
jgi:cytochrome c biogenesis protein CcmG/thiol:disulfide interchange protein DsbE